MKKSKIKTFIVALAMIVACAFTAANIDLVENTKSIADETDMFIINSTQFTQHHYESSEIQYKKIKIGTIGNNQISVYDPITDMTNHYLFENGVTSFEEKGMDGNYIMGWYGTTTCINTDEPYIIRSWVNTKDLTYTYITVTNKVKYYTITYKTDYIDEITTVPGRL